MADSTPGTLYIACLYWAFTTMTTVGYGDITPQSDAERIYCIFGMIACGGFYGYVIGSVGTVMASLNLQGAQYEGKMDAVRAYMQFRNFPPRTARRMYRYFKNYYHHKSALDEDEMLDLLSGPLRSEVASHLVKNTLYREPMFHLMPPQPMAAMLPLMKPMIVEEGEFLGSLGEVCWCMCLRLCLCIIYNVIYNVNKGGRVLATSSVKTQASLTKMAYQGNQRN